MYKQLANSKMELHAKCTDGPQATHVCGHACGTMIKLWIVNNRMLDAPGTATQEGVAASIYRAEVAFKILPEVR